jgi:adenosylcobinamide-GDP ribazoletransferase
VTRWAAREGARLALGTLTALPVPPPSRVDREVARAGMLAAPLVGAALSALAAATVAAAAAAGLAPGAAAVLSLAVVALASRGLHLDGLADTADGLASSLDRARALDVLRRGDVGPAGVVALVLVLLLQASALAAAVAAGTGPAVAAVAVTAGRAVLPLACCRPVPAARADGLGAAVAGSVPVPAGLVAAAVVLGAAAAAGAAGGVGPWAGPAGVLAGWVLAGVVVRRCVRRLGGVTGDVLGAAVEVATTGTLLVLSAS